MIDGRQGPGQFGLLSYVAGFYLVAIAFLLPHPGRVEGRSFFEIARSSPWDRWGDWPAAWCSVKIILLSLGVFLLLHACGTLLTAVTRKTFGNLAMFLSAASTLGIWAGLYYLVKAVF
jgi:hypothetical protein